MLLESKPNAPPVNSVFRKDPLLSMTVPIVPLVTTVSQEQATLNCTPAPREATVQWERPSLPVLQEPSTTNFTVDLYLTVRLALSGISVVKSLQMAVPSVLKAITAPEVQALARIPAQQVPTVTLRLARKTSTSAHLALLDTTAPRLRRHPLYRLSATTRLFPACQVLRPCTSAHPSITVLTQV